MITVWLTSKKHPSPETFSTTQVACYPKQLLRAVSRNVTKLKQWESPPNWKKYENNRSEHEEKVWLNNTANTKDRGTQREIWRKRPKTNNNISKAFWSHFKHFRRLLGKMYPFLTPRKTDGRVPNQQGTTYNLQPDLLGSFAEDVYVQTLNYGPVWVWPKGKIQTFSWGVVGGGGGLGWGVVFDT